MQIVFVQALLASACAPPSLSVGESNNSSRTEQEEYPTAVLDQIVTPTSGVELTGGILKTVFDNNVQYLLKTYPVDDILYCFRQRVGDLNPPGRSRGWEHAPPLLYGSLAGCFSWAAGMC